MTFTKDFFGVGNPNGAIQAMPGIYYVDIQSRIKYQQSQLPFGSSWKVVAVDVVIDLTAYQPLLVSNVNIKTINGISILGGGDISTVSVPSAFDFTDQTGLSTNTVIFSNIITLSGDPDSVWDFVVRHGNNALLSINGGSYAAEGMARDGDTIQLKMTSSLVGLDTVTCDLYCNNIHVDWSITTAAFLPTSIAGLKLWLSSDLGITKDGFDKVSNWADQSINGNDATQATASKKPLWVNNTLNGKPVIRFDGSDDFMSLTSLISTARTIFLVIKHATGNQAYVPTLGGSSTYDFIGGATTEFYLNGTASPNLTGGSLYENGVSQNPITYNKPASYKYISIIATGNVSTDYITNDRNVAGRCWNGDYA